MKKTKPNPNLRPGVALHEATVAKLDKLTELELREVAEQIAVTKQDIRDVIGATLVALQRRSTPAIGGVPCRVLE